MGEVYRARDTKLNRDVAIKVLLPAVANDPDRLARFSREAQVLAALNHPNIAHIYGLEDQALIMELVEGPTLADLVQASPSGLQPSNALAIAHQIAAALEAAHEHGIIHRDLKPANIKVRDDGTVKVLDFGLAKALGTDQSSAVSSASMSPTLSVHGTQAGMILGTAAYMSPEQAAGKPADKRSDLWSFGAVLFEMLTARRAFDGEDVSYVLASVLKDTPDWNALPANTPAQIRKLLRNCLEKSRKQRLDSATAARLEIEDAIARPVAETSSQAVPAALPPVAAWRRAAPMLAGVLLGAVLAGAVMLTSMNWTSAPATSEPTTTPALAYKPLSFEPGGNSDPVWSPDGKGVAFAARQREDEPPQVYVRYLDSSTSTQLTHLGTGAWPVAWTTAGRIVFRTDAAPAGLWTISQTGGAPEPLLAGAGTRNVAGVAGSAGVSSDGSAVAYYGRDGDAGKFGVWISAPAGSPPRRYEPAPFEADSLVNAPKARFSPDGKQLLLARNTGRGEEVWLLPYPPDANQPPRRIFETTLPPAASTPVFSWMPDSRRLIVSINSGLEPPRLFVADTLSGEFTLLSSGTTAQTQPSVSPDGNRLVFTETTDDYDVVQVNIRSGNASPILATRRHEDMPAWSMKAAALTYVTDRTGQSEVWLHQPGQPDRPITTARDFPAGTNPRLIAPMLSPDGNRVIYLAVQSDGVSALWVAAVSGGAPVRVTDADLDNTRERPGAWSPDGAWFVYWKSEGGTSSLNRVRTSGRSTPEVLIPKVVTGLAVPVWSPTGEWILHWNAGWHLTSPDGKVDRDLELATMVCTFSRDGAELYCGTPIGSGGVLFSRPVAGGPERELVRLPASLTPVTRYTPALRMTFAPDGEHLTFSVRKREENLWLIEGLGQAR